MRFAIREAVLWLVILSAGPAYTGPRKLPGDVNADGTLNVGDVIYLLGYLFGGGPEGPDQFRRLNLPGERSFSAPEGKKQLSG